MEKKEIIINVVDQVTNMYHNNVIIDIDGTSFENWCEGGGVFELNGHTGADLERHKEIMKTLAPFVDRLSQEIDKLFNQA